MDTQERVLGWYRARHMKPQKARRGAPMKPRPGDTVSAEGAAFWGIGG